jgi:hypothetical protein
MTIKTKTPLSICLTEDARALRAVLRMPSGPIEQRTATGIIDVGEGGRLLGIEVVIGASGDSFQVDIDPPSGSLSRTATTTVMVETDGSGTVSAIVVPRRGPGYEITYPSGNQ